MTTTDKLTATLAEALGLPDRLVNETARHLREAKMLPAGEVTVEDAVTLLLGLMAAPDPESAPDCARLYAQLPFTRVTRTELMPDGRFETFDLFDDEPVVEELKELGETFGTFLTGFARGFNDTRELAIEPGNLIAGGGLGTAFASLQIFVLADGAHVAGSVQFSLEPQGGGRHPDDAPKARLDVYASMPGTIFNVLRSIFTGDSEGPRHVVMSKSEVHALKTGGTP